MNLLTLPSESQVMSTSVALRSGNSFSRWIGMIGKQRAERPVVEQRLEDGEVAEGTGRRARPPFPSPPRGRSASPWNMPTTCLGDLPVRRPLDAGLRVADRAGRARTSLERSSRISWGSCRLSTTVLSGDVLGELDDVLTIGGSSSATASTASALGMLLDRAEGLDHEDRVMRDDGAAALAHDGGMRHLLGVADLHDVVDDVARVLLRASSSSSCRRSCASRRSRRPGRRPRRYTRVRGPSCGA